VFSTFCCSGASVLRTWKSIDELHEKWNCMYKMTEFLVTIRISEKTRNVGITILEKRCGIREIERFQRYLVAENIAIKVYNFSTFGRGENPLFDVCAFLSRA